MYVALLPSDATLSVVDALMMFGNGGQRPAEMQTFLTASYHIQIFVHLCQFERVSSVIIASNMTCT